MPVGGSWARQNVYFTGAAKQGSGGYAIHGIRDGGHGRAATLDPAADLQDVPDQLLDEQDWGYAPDTYMEPEAGLRSVGERPGWNEKPDRSNTPGDYPAPGHIQAAQEFHSVPHASQEEALRSPQPFRGTVTGGWLAKATSRVNYSTPAPAQYEINTSMTQGMGVKSYSNDRAVARGTDVPRSPIQSRTVAMVARKYGKSWEMGGGPGTPRMFPFQQNQLRRPFYYRSPNLGPVPDAPYNVIEGRLPMQYQAPAEPDTGQLATSSSGDNWGYTEGDYYV